MQVITHLRELPPVPVQAVIINCGTRWVSTLALLSTLRHAGLPVLVIDCESADGSERHFQLLSRQAGIKFHWLAWPLRPHGMTLDRLFSEIAADTVLLVDSDVDIRDAGLVDDMCRHLREHGDAYGAGFLQPGEWLGPPQHLLPPSTGYFAERMWIPLVLLRTAPVREAIAAGASFMARRPFQEVAGYPRLSRLLGYRFRVPGLRHIKLPQPAARGGSAALWVDGIRPAFVDYDTGAALHARLTTNAHPLAAMPVARWGGVHHYHGVTRARLGGVLRAAAAKLGMVSKQSQAEPLTAEEDAKQRLAAQYGIDIASLA